MEDVYGGTSDDDWDADVDNGGAEASSRSKELPSRFERYSHLLLERDKHENPSSFSGLFDWVIESARTGAPLFPTLWGDVVTLWITAMCTCFDLLEHKLPNAERLQKT